MKYRNTLPSLALLLVCQFTLGNDYTLAINNGRGQDPETGLDALRHIGINNGAIVSASETPLAAESVIDATGLVVTPGFIDLHTHSPFRNRFGLSPMAWRQQQ